MLTDFAKLAYLPESLLLVVSPTVEAYVGSNSSIYLSKETVVSESKSTPKLFANEKSHALAAQ